MNRERIRNALITFQEWILPWLSPDPYIPDGTDENERELQLSLHNFLKVPIEFHLRSTMIVFHQMYWVYMPYEEDGLTYLDWYCSIICHFYVTLLLASFFISFVNRRKALILHFISINFMIALSPAHFLDYFWNYFYGESLRHPSAYSSASAKNYHVLFWGNLSITLLYVFFVAYTAYLYYLLKRYRKLRAERIHAFQLKLRRHLFGG
uniref:Transmembrane protein 18 n=1 Tax=Panagrolaimus sp. ES5 TaxID=591445 RepID=A0AC34FB63_9BILA